MSLLAAAAALTLVAWPRAGLLIGRRGGAWILRERVDPLDTIRAAGL